MRILSGIQPTGALHLGNYFGMMQAAIDLQNQGEAFYFIADLHALTSVRDAATLQKNVKSVAVDFLACGLDPQKACFFIQSAIPAVTELTWILGTVTPMGLLERCHSYKDKIAKGIAPSHGLFAYPVLMAADILIYDSDVVPVGRDQKQHLEVTRDIATKMNEMYKAEIFKLPKALIREEAATIPGLDGEKMSKSYNNTVEIFEAENSFRKKIMSIKTDSTPVDQPKQTEGSAILGLYKLAANETDYKTMEDEFRKGGVGYGDFKKRLFGALWEYFAPMRERRNALIEDPDFVYRALHNGAAKASAVSNGVMERVRDAIGIKK